MYEINDLCSDNNLLRVTANRPFIIALRDVSTHVIKITAATAKKFVFADVCHKMNAINDVNANWL